MLDLSALKRERDQSFVAKAGPALYEELLPELRRRPAARYVVIEVETGSYTTGETMAAAADAFERKFGSALGYVRRVE